MSRASAGGNGRSSSVVGRHASALSTAAVQRMEERYRWFQNLSAQERSWVGLVAQAGIAAFVSWYEDPQDSPPVSGDIFATAPRELTRSVTLAQTLDLVRCVIDVIEEQVTDLADSPAQEADLRMGVLRYSREVAFAAAQVYARAAEARGAWDARLESLVVNSVLRGEADESLQSRAASLGWGSMTDICVVVGPAPEVSEPDAVRGVRRAAEAHGLETLASAQGRRLIVLVGGADDPLGLARLLLPAFGEGPVVVGPVVPQLFAAGRSARAALSGWDAVPAWPDAPVPVSAEDLLPERVLAGDPTARRLLLRRVDDPLHRAGAGLVETATTYLEEETSTEGTARALFVHANTVRYRLGRITEITGYDLTVPRDAWTVRTALALGRLTRANPVSWRDSLT